MYPRLLEIPFFGRTITVYSFGAMVAFAIFVAAWLTAKELKRKRASGEIGPLKRAPKKKSGGPAAIQEPADLVTNLTLIAGVVGIAGSRLFHLLENPQQFFADPIGAIFSQGGLTWYGGLICAGLAIAWYARKKGLSIPVLGDAMAPSLMLGYGLGRIGCHLSGDGDWGIASNMALKPDWLPTWFWAETYPNNYLGEVIAAPGVYPTPLYELLAATLLFGLLWFLRDHRHRAGWLFGVYLFLNGFERFWIEKIRVNVTMEFLGMTVTQAELIAVLLMIGGIGLALFRWPRVSDSGTPATKERKSG